MREQVYNSSEVESFFIECCVNHERIIDMINELVNFCEKHVFILNSDQILKLYGLLQESLILQKKDVTESLLQLVFSIISFDEEFNNELFADEVFIELLIQSFPSKFAIDSLSVLALSNIENAKLIISYHEKYCFSKYLELGTQNLDHFILFACSFLKYPELHMFLIKETESIVEICISDIHYSLKYESLRYIYQAFMNSPKQDFSNSLVLLTSVSSNKSFFLIFQTSPDEIQMLDLILLILRELSFKCPNAFELFSERNLFPFLQISIQSEDDIVICYTCDIIGEIAHCGDDAIQVLVEFGFIDSLWQIIDNDHSIQARNCSVLSLLLFLRSSSDEYWIPIIERDFFSILAETMEFISKYELDHITNVLLGLIYRSLESNCPIIINSISSNDELLFRLQTIYEENEEPSATFAYQSIQMVNNHIDRISHSIQ